MKPERFYNLKIPCSRDLICSSSFAMCRRKSLISSHAGESLRSLMLPKDGISAAEEGCSDRLGGEGTC